VLGAISLLAFDFLLRRGMDVDAKLSQETGLHWAAYEGHAGIVNLLLQHGVPVDVKDNSHDGTPLDWALYAWGNPDRFTRRDYYEVVALLARAGASVDPLWYANDYERQRAAKKMKSDPRMGASLRGQILPP
jgi:ankyrin repeat protein